MPTARLTDRAVVRVSGAEAKGFLDRLVTCDLDRLAPGRARYGALLTPQGKIIADFVAHEDGEGAIWLDLPASCTAELVKRLTLYRLRAKIAIVDLTADRSVLAGWGGTAMPTGGALLAAPDPRLAALGWRAVVERDGLVDAGVPDEGVAAWHAHRIAEGVPDGDADFRYGDAFPHEILMDQLAGVDFDKGCYVGQEVVSRMQHRGTARTRIVAATYPGEAPAPGTPVTAGDRALGETGSRSGDRGLATIRLDRAADAIEAGAPLEAGGAALRLAKPGFVRFPYPGEAVPA